MLLPGAKAPHFAYVGDSILGHGVNLGAGTKLSNTPITHGRRITITIDDVTYDTGLDKLGAIGDGGQTGCNAVLNPGVVLGPRVLVYPNVSVRGYHAADSILEMRQDIEPTTRR